MRQLEERHPLVVDLLILVAGVSIPLAFAPFGYWPLAILLPVVLLWGWDGATPRRAALRGGLFGLGMLIEPDAPRPDAAQLDRLVALFGAALQATIDS